MRQNGSPPPEFEFDEDHSFFMVWLPIHPVALEVTTSGTATATVDASLEPTKSDNPVARLLLLLQTGAKSSNQLRQALGLKRRPTCRDNYLQPAMQRGFVEYTIPTNSAVDSSNTA